jgi:hypothetical protein
MALNKKKGNGTETVETVIADTIVYKNAPEVEIPTEIGKGVAISWLDSKTAERRKNRSGVSVESVESGKVKGEPRYYTSLRKAFKAESLPDSRHIPFRIRLKIEGKKDYRVNDTVTLRFTNLETETVKEKLGIE